MRRILFVDDQPEILNAHRESMKKCSIAMDTLFALGADAAMEKVRSTPIDVVVADLHMPGTDGAMLLGKIKAEYPDMVRIMLCPQSEMDSFFVSLPVSHQILTKPVDSDTLCNAIERIFALREMLTDSLRKKIGAVEQLPSVPTIYFEMMTAMGRPDVSVIQIARILEKDSAMAVKTLQLVNSACLGLSRPITKLDHAVAYLGMELVRDLSLTVRMFAALEPTALRHGFSFHAEQQHSLIVAKIARRLVSGPRQIQSAFTAGLLHDIGKLVLAVCVPEKFKTVVQLCKSGRPSHEVEAETLGVTHAEVGAYLLGLWGLPHPIVEAVAYHHNPSAAMERHFDVPSAVSVANALVEEIAGKRSFPLAEHLKSHNVLDKLPRWTAMAREEMQQTKPEYARAI